MNTIAEIQKQIMELKKEKDFCILAHCYQSQEILEVADIVGDSYALSKKAVEVPQQNVLMCGCPFHGGNDQDPFPAEDSISFQPERGLPDGRTAGLRYVIPVKGNVSGLHGCGLHQHNGEVKDTL